MACGLVLVVRLDLDDPAADPVGAQFHPDQFRCNFLGRPVEEAGLKPLQWRNGGFPGTLAAGFVIGCAALTSTLMPGLVMQLLARGARSHASAAPDRVPETFAAHDTAQVAAAAERRRMTNLGLTQV